MAVGNAKLPVLHIQIGGTDPNRARNNLGKTLSLRFAKATTLTKP